MSAKAGELGMGGCAPYSAWEEEEDPAAAKGSPFKALQAGLGPPHDCEADRDPGCSGNLGQSLPLSFRLLSPGATVIHGTSHSLIARKHQRLLALRPLL